MQFHIENMTCFGCARSVTKAIQSVDKAAVIKADPENRKIEVETSAARAERKPSLCAGRSAHRACSLYRHGDRYGNRRQTAGRDSRSRGRDATQH